jgi:hypothetical protein
MVANLAQEGARFASVHGKTSSCPVSESQVSAFIKDAGSVCGTPGRAAGSYFTVTTPGGAPSSIDRGSAVTVRVVSSFSPLTNLVPFSTMTLQSNSAQIVAR